MAGPVLAMHVFGQIYSIHFELARHAKKSEVEGEIESQIESQEVQEGQASSAAQAAEGCCQHSGAGGCCNGSSRLRRQARSCRSGVEKGAAEQRRSHTDAARQEVAKLEAAAKKAKRDAAKSAAAVKEANNRAAKLDALAKKARREATGREAAAERARLAKWRRQHSRPGNFLGSYRTNNGHHRTLARRGSVAIDPKRPLARSRTTSYPYEIRVHGMWVLTSPNRSRFLDQRTRACVENAPAVPYEGNEITDPTPAGSKRGPKTRINSANANCPVQ